MGHINLPPSKRIGSVIFFTPRHWKLLDFISFCFFAAVIVFFLLIFTSLGDSLAASGRRTLALSSDPRQRERILAIFEDGGDGYKAGQRKDSARKTVEGDGAVIIDSCSIEEVDHMPCEDPRRNSQLSRKMNFYRERHCPTPEETKLCLIPPPDGYHVPIPWPQSLHKVCFFLYLATLKKMGQHYYYLLKNGIRTIEDQHYYYI